MHGSSFAGRTVEKSTKAGTLFQVRCACGAESAVDVGAFGRPLRCKACSGTYKIVWSLDPKSKKKIPLAVGDSGKTQRVYEISAGAQEVVCRCSQHFLAWPKQVGKRVQCPVCATWLKLERYKDPQTQQTRLRTVESRINRLPEAPAPAKKSPEPDVQDILCTCGESLRMGAEHLGKQVQCPACGTLMRLEKKRDPETSVIAIHPRIVGKAEPPKKRGIDEDLSLDDFR